IVFLPISCNMMYIKTAPKGPRLLAAQTLHCSPCTAEQLSRCPPVPAGCAEVLQEQGCGCCSTCALQQGDLCGVYTARCGEGLRCYPKQGDPRPLHSLTWGQAICIELAEVERIQIAEATETKQSMENENKDMEDREVSQGQIRFNHRSMPTVGQAAHDKPDPWNNIDAQESMKAKKNCERRKWKEQGPCQKELYRSLEKIAKTQQRAGEVYQFYLPNCDRHGFYHTKQCETSLDRHQGRCWCVFPWNGKKITGSPEIRGDLDCQQYFALQN
uniref:Insulin-like growth factor-binding protein 1 n=1 Tax=Latimeria chalumnae TaxID=7897 RepID=H2ZV30_LATCH